MESAAKKGSKSAKVALELSENPTKFLSTIQIGITLIGILLGVYGGETITKTFVEYISCIELLAPFAHEIGTGLSVLLITYLSIVLGELFPKRLAMTFPERIALIVAKPMQVLSLITSPFVWLLTVTNNFLLRVFGIKKTSESKASEEEIKAMVKDSADGGEIQEIEQDIVERVFEMGDKKVTSLYTSRNDIVYFDIKDDLSTIKKKINSEKHSAYPVCVENNLDKIRGIVLLKDLFDDSIDPFDLTLVMKQPIFINENTSAFKVLEQFKQERMHNGIVIDEFGVTVGVVTMDDILDALIGDATEQEVHEYSIVQTDNNMWLADGFYSLSEFQKFFGLDLDEAILAKYTTISGLFIFHYHKIPNLGDTLTLENYTLQIMDKDGPRVDKILITKN